MISHGPGGIIRVSTYEKLEEFVAAFAAGHINLLILVGSPGLAKTRTVKRVLKENACWIQGHATAMGLFQALYRNRDKFVVIDDVDSLYSDKNGVRLLKCLCQTEDEKGMAWHSAARALEKDGIPREFVTRSRVIIICNDWRTLNKNVAAIEDRGHVVEFCPTPAELHRQVGTWFDEPDVYTWFGENLHLVEEPTMRLYIRARELKRSGMDWMQILPLAPENPRRRLVAELLADSVYATQEARAKEFSVRGGGCRATYFNHARKLRGVQKV